MNIFLCKAPETNSISFVMSSFVQFEFDDLIEENRATSTSLFKKSWNNNLESREWKNRKQNGLYLEYLLWKAYKLYKSLEQRSMSWSNERNHRMNEKQEDTRKQRK